MRSLNDQEINTIQGAALDAARTEFMNKIIYYGAATGTTAGALGGAIKILSWGAIWTPLGFIGGGLMGTAAGAACGAIAIIPLSAIFCPPDYANLFFGKGA